MDVLILLLVLLFVGFVVGLGIAIVRFMIEVHNARKFGDYAVVIR